MLSVIYGSIFEVKVKVQFVIVANYVVFTTLIKLLAFFTDSNYRNITRCLTARCIFQQ
jgi:hypothetical protein